MNRRPTAGCSDAFAEKLLTASNGSLELVGYTYTIPRPFQGCWSPSEVLDIQEHLQAIQEHSDHILSP